MAGRLFSNETACDQLPPFRRLIRLPCLLGTLAANPDRLCPTACRHTTSKLPKVCSRRKPDAALGHKKLHSRFIPNYPPSPLHLLHATPILCDTLQRVYQGLSALDCHLIGAWPVLGPFLGHGLMGVLFTFGLTLASNCLLCFCFLGDSESMPSCQTWLCSLPIHFQAAQKK